MNKRFSAKLFLIWVFFCLLLVVRLEVVNCNERPTNKDSFQLSPGIGNLSKENTEKSRQINHGINQRPYHFFTPNKFYENVFGAMFTVEAKSEITITSLGFRSDDHEQLIIRVYKIFGSYKGQEDNASEWILISETDVRANGGRNITNIPQGPEYFEEVTMKKGDIVSFFITASSAALQASKVDVEMFTGKQMAYNPDMILSDGSSMAEGEYSGYREQYMFNGVINYRRGILVSKAEENSVKYWELVRRELDTTMEAGVDSFGCIFYVRAKERAIRIETLEFHAENQNVAVKIFSLPGKFHPNSKARNIREWNLLSDTILSVNRTSGLARIPENDFETVLLYPGEIKSFYVSLETKDLKLSQKPESSVAKVASSDNSLEILLGYGVEDLLANKITKGQLFNGKLHFVNEAAQITHAKS